MMRLRASESRFHALAAAPARLILLLLAFALAASLLPAAQTVQPPPAKTAQDDGDLLLYEAIVARMQAGQGYYDAAVTEQRARHYPLRPFPTVRLPSLASILAIFGKPMAQALMLLIWISAVIAWQKRLKPHVPKPIWASMGAALLLCSILPVIRIHYVTVHELWASGLLALALALYRPQSWRPTLLLAACALAIREHSLPVLFLIAAHALWQRRWPELAAWVSVILGFALLLWLHGQMVMAVTLPTDHISPGWVTFGGVNRAMMFFYQTSWLRILPQYLAYPLIILSLFGWLSWRNRLGLLVSLCLLGYGMIFAILGRPDTFYWGFLMGPLLGMGMVFLRLSLAPLIQAAWPRQLDLAAT